jgi:hypothetical protein
VAGRAVGHDSHQPQPIDTMETLQGFVNGQSKITNASGVVEFARTQRMMEKLVRDRQASGINPAKSIPDATMDSLFNLPNDMARENLNTQLAKTPGSDTVQIGTAWQWTTWRPHPSCRRCLCANGDCQIHGWSRQCGLYQRDASLRDTGRRPALSAPCRSGDGVLTPAEASRSRRPSALRSVP